jgi:hypothetical protein
MTIESVIERVEPFARKVCKLASFAVTLCYGGALTLAAVGVAILAALQLHLPDATLLLQQVGDNPPSSVSDVRDGLLFLVAAAVAVMVWGLHKLHDLFRPHENRQRVAALEIRLREAEQFAAIAAESTTDIEWMREALAAVEHVFSIPGVVEAARKAARKALHPDGHPGAGADEIHELTRRFQSAEAVFDRFSN